MSWAYGVTSCKQRKDTLLPQTLASLKAGGFGEPHLFIDGCEDVPSWREQFPGLEMTFRYPHLRVHGNWCLSLSEMFIRNPTADRFALFQDDLSCVQNLRQYLEKTYYPSKVYWNLYTATRTNEPVVEGKPPGTWHEGGLLNPDSPERWQAGRGAVALVFDREAVQVLLSSRALVERPLNPHRGWRAVDGGIVNAMNQAGYREMVHCPSLVQHTGALSAMDKRKTSTGQDDKYPVHWWGGHDLAKTFPGSEFDAMTWLEEKKQ